MHVRLRAERGSEKEIVREIERKKCWESKSFEVFYLPMNHRQSYILNFL